MDRKNGARTSVSEKIIIFSIFNWNANLLHREHKLAEVFTNEGNVVIFIEKKNFSTRMFGNNKRTEGGIKVISFYGLPYLKGRFKFIYKLNDIIFSRQIKKYFPKEVLDDSILMLTTPNWYGAIKKMKPKILCYDMSDDLISFSTNNSWKKNMQEYERELIERSDIVITTSENLKYKVKNKDKIRVIHNGVDTEELKESSPEVRKTTKGKIVGFIGGIYEWVDLDLIKKAAIAIPDATFLLAGPTDKKEELEKLNKIENIRYVGAVERTRVGNFFASLDVGLVPFVSEEVCPRLKTVDSNKIYQYLFFGYPIVATLYAQTKDLEKILYLASDEKEFIEKIKISLRENSNELRRARTTFALENTWQSRGSDILRAFSSIKK